ncbi:hypothetical protein [Amycolatopsis taiwanensis]|uniref:hypothetical protein n=1 Tax=Amycolatopsis taiwanensis TaxID=342230 RepID=UPI000483A637|nr:hypothetical protein [Amycolatopsis taiwanensis]
MSAYIDGSVPDARQAPVVVFEPRGDRPAREEPLIAPVLRSLARKRRLALVIPPLFLAIVVLPFLFPGRSDLGALPVLSVTGGAVALLFATYNWWHSRPAGWKKLLERPIRRVEFGAADIRTTRWTAWLRVVVGPDELWIRTWMVRLVGSFAARKGYLWVLGPYSGGRVLVFLPGLIIPASARLRRTPARDARPIAPMPGVPSAPKDDPVLVAMVRFNRRLLLGMVALLLAAVGWLIASYGPDLVGDPPRGRETFVRAGIFMAVVWVALVCVALVRLPLISRVAHARGWTPVRVAFDGPMREGATKVNLAGRVWLPDGTERSVRLRAVNVGLAASMQASGVLWVIGAPRAYGSLAVGVPGHPLIGFGAVRRKRKAS